MSKKDYYHRSIGCGTVKKITPYWTYHGQKIYNKLFRSRYVFNQYIYERILKDYVWLVHLRYQDDVHERDLHVTYGNCQMCKIISNIAGDLDYFFENPHDPTYKYIYRSVRSIFKSDPSCFATYHHDDNRKALQRYRITPALRKKSRQGIMLKLMKVFLPPLIQSQIDIYRKELQNLKKRILIFLWCLHRKKPLYKDMKRILVEYISEIYTLIPHISFAKDISDEYCKENIWCQEKLEKIKKYNSTGDNRLLQYIPF